MNGFRVIQPRVLLASYIRQYWFVRMENVPLAAQRLVPLGCVALFFHRGDRVRSSTKEILPASCVYGIASGYADLFFSGTVDFVCVVFQPGMANVFFDISSHELHNQCVSLKELHDPELCALEQQLHEVSGPEQETACIEAFLLRRLARCKGHSDKRILAALEAIRADEKDVGRLAETACLGYKQFKRLFTEQTGTNPKELLRIVRFQKVHHLLQQRTNLTVAQLAEECGYCDKSHLIRELREFSGFTPGQLFDACDLVYSGYHALFRAAFIDLKIT